MKPNLALILLLIGLVMIVVNAADYLAGWNTVPSAIGGIGIVLVAIAIVFGKKLK